jgi:23S rRNA (uracil1939-C5)-methyltransferase
MDPASITYISCNRRTFARDLREFVDQGFIVEGITPYEMFPQTAHCEVVAQLRSPNAVDPKVARGPRRKRVR